jgi:hypothetical protein
MYLLLIRNFQKSGQAAIIGLFHLCREITGGKFSHPAMIIQAFAADTLAATRFIGAVAVLQVLLFVRALWHVSLLYEMIRVKVWR